MIKTLKLINGYISSAEPDRYNNVSYGKYFANLAQISNSILEEKAEIDKIMQRVKDSISKMENCPQKTELQFLIGGWYRLPG